MRYGQGDDESVITEYLDAHLEEGIKQKNLDKVLDLIDDYVELRYRNAYDVFDYASKLYQSLDDDDKDKLVKLIIGENKDLTSEI